jgi:hypothetical protein
MNQFPRDLAERLRRDSDVQRLAELLTKYREEKRVELEDATASLQVHKLQGYCQALSDLIKLLSLEGR